MADKSEQQEEKNTSTVRVGEITIESKENAEDVCKIIVSLLNNKAIKEYLKILDKKRLTNLNYTD